MNGCGNMFFGASKLSTCTDEHTHLNKYVLYDYRNMFVHKLTIFMVNCVVTIFDFWFQSNIVTTQFTKRKLMNEINTNIDNLVTTYIEI